MGNRLTLIMTVAVLAGFATILILNAAALFGFIPPKYISPNDVRGIAIEHDHMLYTLNFQQQNALIYIFNRSHPCRASNVANAPETKKLKISSGIQKIIIYRFNAPDIEIRPAGYVSKTSDVVGGQANERSMLFSAPLWNPNGLLEEAAPDDAEALLLTTYDHWTYF